jgi:hypothetical protein
MQKNIKKSIIGVSVLAAASIIALPLATYAVSNEVEVDATIGASITISSITSSGATPAVSAPSLATVSVTTSTNAGNGYTLSFRDGDANTSLVSEDGAGSIPSIAAASKLNTAATAWGYYAGSAAPVFDTDNFNPIPTASTEVSGTLGAAGTETKSVWFGVSVASNTSPASGVYKDVLVFTSVAKF